MLFLRAMCKSLHASAGGGWQSWTSSKRWKLSHNQPGKGARRGVSGPCGKGLSYNFGNPSVQGFCNAEHCRIVFYGAHCTTILYVRYAAHQAKWCSFRVFYVEWFGYLFVRSAFLDIVAAGWVALLLSRIPFLSEFWAQRIQRRTLGTVLVFSSVLWRGRAEYSLVAAWAVLT